MPLPQKQYYSLQEIADRWGIPFKDVCDYALEEMFEVHAWIGKINVEIGSYEETAEGEPFRIPTRCSWYNGYAIVRALDLREIFRQGSCAVQSFLVAEDKDSYLDITDEKDYIIEVRDLMVSKCARDKVEKEYKLVFDAPPVCALAGTPAPVSQHALPAQMLSLMLSFPGRPTVMHFIFAELESRAAQGKLCGNATQESVALCEWAQANIKDAQVPKPKSIYNRIHKRYRELTLPESRTA